ncbi:retrovirus-related pol polyprotein from transposon TNT 1-94, partial [Tanacetum coccineum]
KADEGVLVGYSISNKAFRVYNHRTRKVEENLHVNFLENQPNIAGNGPKWMNYHPVSAGNRANVNACIETNSDAGQAEKEKVPDQEYTLLPLLHTSSYGPSTSEEACWILLFLSYASYMDYTVYQMDVKSAFLYGTIEEEVYVNQPLGFEDPKFPNKVYKVEKALYGLHQAPRAWYETLSTYLLENRFRRGTIDKTLFIKKIKNDILLV